MAGRKASGITWNISVNSVGARTQISLLKRQLRELDRSWKANYHSLVAAGRYEDALKEKHRGLIAEQNRLKDSIQKTNEMLNASGEDSGTRKYKQTAIDAQQFRTQLTRVGTQIKNNDQLLVLHNDKLRETEQTTRTNSELGRQMIDTYHNEGNSVAENNQKLENYKTNLRDLNHEEQALRNTIRSARSRGLDSDTNPDYTHLIVQLNRVKAAEAKVRTEQSDLDSGLSTGVKYDNLYNQSTNKVVSSLKQLKGKAEAGRVEYQRLTANIQHEGTVLAQERNKVNAVAKANRSVTDSTGHQSIAFQHENSKLISLNSTYEAHMDKIHKLGNSYGAMGEKSARSFDRMTTSIDRSNTAARRDSQTAHALTGSTIALGGAFLYGVKQSVGLENQFVKIKNLLNSSHESMKQSGIEAKEMSKSTSDMAIKYGQSQQTIANGYEALVRRGYNGRQALASQKYYLQGTIASGDQYNDVMHTAASTLEAFGLRCNSNSGMIRHTKTTVDQLAYAADLTATDFKGLGYGMQYVGGAAHNAHQSMSETASILGELSNRGENSTVAATGLRKILLSLATIKTSKNNKALTQLGLQPKDLMDAKGNLKSLQDIFTMFQTKMKGMSSTKQASIFKQLFGMTGYNSATDLLNSVKQVAKLQKDVANAPYQDHGKGYAAKIAQRNMESTEKQLERLKQAGIQLAKDYADGLNPEFKVLAHLAMGVAKGLDKMPEGFKKIATVTTVLIPLAAAMAYVGSAAHKAFSIWKTGFRDVGKGVDIFKNKLSGANKTEKQNIDQTNQSTKADQNNAKSSDQENQSEDQKNESEQQNTKDDQENTNANKQSTTEENNNSKSVKNASKVEQDNGKIQKDNGKVLNDNIKTQKSDIKAKDTDTDSTKSNSTAEQQDSTSDRENSTAKTSNTESTTENSSAKNNNSDKEQEDSSETGSDTSSLEKNTGAEKQNATAVGTDTGALKSHTSAEKSDSSAGGSSSGGSSKSSPVKSNIGKFGLGTVMGLVGGENLSDAADDGLMATPLSIPAMLARPAIDRTAPNISSAVKKFAQSHGAPKSKKFFDSEGDKALNHIKNAWHKTLHQMFTPLGHAQKVAQKESRAMTKANAATDRQMSKATKSFVRGESRDLRRAELAYRAHRGRMTKAERGYFRSSERRAAAYEKQRGKAQRAHLRDLYKQGRLTRKEYQKEDKLSRQHEARKLKQLKRDEKNLEKDSNKNYKTRKKALDRYNRDVAKMTARDRKRQLKLQRRLDNRKTRLDQKAYNRTVRASNRAYRRTVSDAVREYHAKLRSYRRSFGATKSWAARTYGVHSRAYRRIVSRARSHEEEMESAARGHYHREISDARSRARAVVSAANREKESSVRAARSEHGSWSRSAGYISSHPIKIKHITIYKTEHEHAGGTLDTQALHLAIGNLPGIAKSENAVINDGSGRELVKLPNGQLVLPSGRNIHTYLPKGTSVFNAIDTKKILGILQGMDNPIHHAGGTSDTQTGGIAGFAASSSGNSAGNSFNSLDQTAHDTKQSVDKIHDTIDSGYQKAADDANGHLQDIHDNSDSVWSDIFDKTKQHVKDIHYDTSSRWSDLTDIILKLNHKMYLKNDSHLDYMNEDFYRHFDKLSPKARRELTFVIHDMDRAIHAINETLSQFGGNHHVLSPIHLATGSTTPTMQNRLAMVNDANTGPAQEAIVSDTGHVRYPQGRNVITELNPGDQVLSGSDTELAIKNGLIPHYAHGKSSLKALVKLLHRAISKKGPSVLFKDLVARPLDDKADNFTGGMDRLISRGARGVVVPWTKAMFGYIKGLLNPDTGGSSNSVLLNEMHKLGDGHTYLWGAAGPTHYDCGGLVMAALHALGMPSEHTSYPYPTIPANEATTGDIVQSSTHVGVVADPHHRTYFSAYGPDLAPDSIKTQPLTNEYFTPGHPFYFRRPWKLYHEDQRNAAIKDQSSSKGSKGLNSLVKKELGANASKWISKNAEMINDGGEANFNTTNIPGGPGSWTKRGTTAYNIARDVFFAAKSLGLDAKHAAAVVGNAWHESAGFEYGLKVNQFNGGGGKGLFQFTGQPSRDGWTPLGQTKSILANGTYPGEDQKWGHSSGSPYSLAESFESDFERGSIPAYAARAQAADTAYGMFAGGSYATGGLSVSDKLAHISEGNKPEMVLPLTDRSRAVELMLKSLQYMFGNDNGSNNHNNDQDDHEQLEQDRRFEQELIQSNRNKDRMIQNILNKMTLLIKTVQEKPVLSNADIYNANRSVNMKKLRLRNLNRGTF